VSESKPPAPPSSAEVHNAVASVVALYGRMLELAERRAAYFEEQWKASVAREAKARLESASEAANAVQVEGAAKVHERGGDAG
jgi:hypothetical protein